MPLIVSAAAAAAVGIPLMVSAAAAAAAVGIPLMVSALQRGRLSLVSA
jgi:hypothetical protein